MSRPSPVADSNAKTLARAEPAAGGVAVGSYDVTLAGPAAQHGRFDGPWSSETGARVAVDGAAWSLEAASFEQRYEMRSTLGAGGMGEVRLCRDRLVGRDVALKVMLPEVAAQASAAERFVREARVQGQLEHPAIVPVYDLGVASRGYAYFTMKRIRGRTLDEIIRLLAAGDAATAAKYTRRRLLTAFGSVCLAIDFAHRHGVLHRDLKPSNLILGDYGEVYVLDWGLAKVAGAEDGAGDRVDVLLASGQTMQGTLLGTPGYMAPEQVRGEIDRLDERTDVYALGAILFEIVALDPLHRAPTTTALLASTLRGADARPTCRGAPDVPPELEAICVRATALDPGSRYPTTRALSDALERFLDGDRNEALRRDLAKDHVAAARAALDRSARGDDARADRALALREAASALALDPSNAEALGTMAQLLVSVPSEVPREAQAGLDAAAASARRDAARLIAIRFVLWSAFLPLALWMGVRSYPITLLTIALVLACGAISWVLSRRAAVGLRLGFALLALSSVTVAMMSALFGPFILVPGLAATNTMFFAMSADRPARRVVLFMGALIVVVPFLLEVLGAIPPAYGFGAGLFEVLPRATQFPAFQTTLCLGLVSIAMIIIPGVAVGRLRDRLSAAEQRLYLQAWNLSQLVPSAARHALAEGSGTSS